MDTDTLCKKSKGKVEVVAWRVKRPLAVPAFHTGVPASVLASISHSAFRQHSRRQQVMRSGTPVLTRHAGDPDGVPVSHLASPGCGRHLEDKKTSSLSIFFL